MAHARLITAYRAASAAVFAALPLLLPGQAHAHLADVGLGPFLDGLAHPFLSLPELAPLLALALCAGLAGPYAGRTLAVWLPATWFLASMAGLRGGFPADAPMLTGALSLVLGSGAAAGVRLPRMAVVALACVTGALLGLLDGGAMREAAAGTGVAAGITISVALVVVIIAGNGASLTRQWHRIAMRVAGSWIAALGLLSIGWAVRALQ